MTETLQQGTTATVSVTVDKDRTIGFMGEELRVYATPALVGDIEYACRDLIAGLTPEGQDSVGTEVAIRHLAPTPLGMDVTITVTVAELDGRSVVFDITATDPLDTICKGRHERFIVDIDKTRERLEAKKAAGGAA